MKILILCTGNSCRSQMAHGFLQSFDKDIQVYSAGTHPAEKVNPLAVEAMAEVGIDISRHIPTNVTAYLSDTWDYVIPLDCTGFEFCPEITAKVLKKGYKIKEVAISYTPRSVEEGKKIKWTDGLEAIWVLLKYRIR